MASAFYEANLIYVQLASSEAYVMRALSGNEFPNSGRLPKIAESPELDNEGLDEYRTKLIYDLLREAEAEPGDQKTEFARHWESARALEFSGSNIGIFGLPDSAYLDLCSSVAQLSETGVSKPLAVSLAPFVTTYDHAIQSAFRNGSNWALLAQRIHPAEPDIVGLLAMVHLALRRSELREALNTMPMSELSRTLLFGSLETRFPDDFRNAARKQIFYQM
jgi:hypothetical protein